MGKVIHIGSYDKFTTPLVELINNKTNHYNIFIFNTNSEIHSIPKNTIIFGKTLKSRILFYFQIITKMNNAKKIIIHGLFDPLIALILILNKSNRNKYYWVLWGGDLYSLTNYNKILKKSINKTLRFRAAKIIPNIVTYLKQDFTILCGLTNQSNKKMFDCLLYPSNIVEAEISTANSSPLYFEKEVKNEIIVVGNSGDPGNNHNEVFELLQKSKHNKASIYCPLGYGNKKYINQIIHKGKNKFSNNFHPILEFVERNEYQLFLNKIDILIYAHERQQGMGTLIYCLAMGKKIFLKEKTSSYKFLTETGFNIGRLKDLNEIEIKISQLEHNKMLSKKVFSEDKLIATWCSIINATKK